MRIKLYNFTLIKEKSEKIISFYQLLVHMGSDDLSDEEYAAKVNLRKELLKGIAHDLIHLLEAKQPGKQKYKLEMREGIGQSNSRENNAHFFFAKVFEKRTLGRNKFIFQIQYTAPWQTYRERPRSSRKRIYQSFVKDFRDLPSGRWNIHFHNFEGIRKDDPRVKIIMEVLFELRPRLMELGEDSSYSTNEYKRIATGQGSLMLTSEEGDGKLSLAGKEKGGELSIKDD